MQPKRVLTAAAVLGSLIFPPAARAQEAKQPARAPVVAVFSLDKPITESPRAEDFPFATSPMESLKDLVARLKKARDDETIKGIVLLVENALLGSAQIEEMREVMDQFKAAGKEIHVHADSLAMSSYLLASGATKISVVPTGDLLINGIYGEQLYLRGLFDKIGVQPDFVTCGQFKSAAEMFMRTGPSPEAEQMHSWLFDGIYDTSVTLIAQGRGVPSEKVRAWIDHGLYTAEKAKQEGIIDEVQYRQDFVDQLRAKYGADLKFDKRYGRKKQADVDFSSPLAVFKLWTDLFQGPKSEKAHKNRIAVVYVDGPIVPGAPQPGLFGSDGIAFSTPIRKALDEVARDDTFKAAVLRVSSPGGSAVASEIILNATKRVKAKKPFVVSMGDVAGSGGYYVACGADTIFAGRSTITGSIGVLGGKLSTAQMWNKLGVHWKPIQRGANAGILSSSEPFTDAQREQLHLWMKEIYEVFKGHVRAVRGERLKKDIEELAGGRVYTGNQALELGLIDRIGGLDDAVQFVAKQAKLEEFDVQVMPRPKSFMEIVFADLKESDSDSKYLSLARSDPVLRQARSLLDAALPIFAQLDPRRAQATAAAFWQLAMLREERALLVMPQILIGE